MARDSIFTRKRKEKGKEWLKVTNPNELIKMSENILSDIAYGNLSSDEDKWNLVDPVVLQSLLEFCKTRAQNLYYIAIAMQKYRDTAEEADNASHSIIFDNTCKSLEIYNTCLTCIDGYMKTGDKSYMINLYARLGELKNYINPSKFI
jgi:hypothetical protein